MFRFGVEIRECMEFIKKILESYDFCWATGVQKPDGSGEDINKGSLPLNSDRLPDVTWTFDYGTVPGTAEFSMKGLLRYNLGRF